jgi:hypothetical protein
MFILATLYGLLKLFGYICAIVIGGGLLITVFGPIFALLTLPLKPVFRWFYKKNNRDVPNWLG